MGAAATGLAMLVVGCVQPTAPPVPSLTPSEPPVFTVGTAQQVASADPAVLTRDVDAIVGTSVYQRLMRMQSGTRELKPDAATDCIFTSSQVYECTLPAGLKFHNGNALTASDVRFSIQRALRLQTADTAIGLFDSLESITVPDATTVRFRLSYSDSQFGYALASLAASIVDEESYDPDAPLALDVLPVGSGPYQVTEITEEGVRFQIFTDYRGPLVGEISELLLVPLADSVAAEAAMKAGKVDVVWRTLDDPALARLVSNANATPKPTHEYVRIALPGRRVNQLMWNPESEYRDNKTLREGVAAALQSDRTLDSLVPVGIKGRIDVFPVGGRPKLPKLKSRVNLRLGYDPTAPGHADLARLLRDRLEQVSSLSVRVVTNGDADLFLTDNLPWVDTALGWLQCYLSSPLADSAEQLTTLELVYRSDAAQQRALEPLQRQAALDLTVLPISQTDGILVVKDGVTLVGEPMGPGGQLGLWGIRDE
ncbi:MAG: ABC transporter substrate-binding protein [Propionibacteriaceae bacterium]|nr:ABC transporter substrate-binding protein [Propionibacteriaceae bacterium]